MPQPKSSKLCHTSTQRSRLFLGMGLIGLHRAIVSLPDALTSRDRPIQERRVFFEAPRGEHPSRHLEKLLALAWGVDTARWAEWGYIYNVDDAYALASDSFAAGDDTGDLCLFETGCGGDIGIGPQRIHYARAADIDLFVTPAKAERLRSTMAYIELLYAAEPTRRAAEAAINATRAAA